MRVFKIIINFIKTNRLLCLIIMLYSAVMVSVITWGIPGQSHPFAYNMDEWHQMMAVRNTFRYGSPNIAGSAHGSIFHFILSGFFLAPFIVTGIINPFVIKTVISAMQMQEKIFIILRLNTLLFGILSIGFLYKIIKMYFRASGVLGVILFIGTPIWLSLASFFKYDIALIFWIILSLYFLLKYAQKPTGYRYLIAAVPCALALSTKISAIPLIPLYVVSFLLFTSKFRKNFRLVIWGVLIIFGIFLIVGIPDIILGKGSLFEYLYPNLVSGPKGDSNIILGGQNKWVYVAAELAPIIFGRIFYALSVIAVGYWIMFLSIKLKERKLHNYKKELFLVFGLLFFIFSLIPLGLGATGNRLLVLHPFFVILTVIFLKKIFDLLNRDFKNIFIALIVIAIAFQLREASVVLYTKYYDNPQQAASKWIVNNIRRGETIGIENIPVYQFLPDIVLKEFYQLENNANAKTNFKYKIVDENTPVLPSIVLITNKNYHLYYLKNSPKKTLLKRLKKEKYKITLEIKPNQELYKLFITDFNFHESGLNAISTVTIYSK